MKKSIYGVLAILCVGLLIFGGLSFMGDEIKVGPVKIKTASFAQTLFAPGDSAEVKDAKLANVDSVSAKPKGPAPMDTTSKNILLVGDSMLEGLGPRLAAYADYNGHTLTRVIWYSSTTEIWGQTTRLKERIDEFKPDYIFICLGANELFVSDIKKKRQKYLDEILSQIGDIPFVWIGPPNWKPDTGINDMLQETLPEGSFYLSNGEHFDRAKDGAHPTHASAAAWCDRVCKWVMEKSYNPIKLKVPTEAKGTCKTIIYQPYV